MQIIEIENDGYSIKHKGNNYVRYTDFDDIPYFISDSNNENGYSCSINEDLEIEFQRELKRIDREKKLNRIIL